MSDMVLCHMPKKDKGHKATSQPSPSAASNKAVVTAIANHRVELAKATVLVDDLVWT